MPLEQIQVYQNGNGEYITGFKLHFRNGQKQLFGSEASDAGSASCEDGDVLVGMKVRFHRENDLRPRRLGFMLIRNGKIHETDTMGNNFGFTTLKYWPEINSIYGRQDVENMKIRKITWSKWSDTDYDLSAIRFYPTEGDDSQIIGETRHGWEEVTLRTEPIQKILVYEKPSSSSYIRGFDIVYRDGQV